MDALTPRLAGCLVLTVYFLASPFLAMWIENTFYSSSTDLAPRGVATFLALAVLLTVGLAAAIILRRRIGYLRKEIDASN